MAFKSKDENDIYITIGILGNIEELHSVFQRKRMRRKIYCKELEAVRKHDMIQRMSEGFQEKNKSREW